MAALRGTVTLLKWHQPNWKNLCKRKKLHPKSAIRVNCPFLVHLAEDPYILNVTTNPEEVGVCGCRPPKSAIRWIPDAGAGAALKAVGQHAFPLPPHPVVPLLRHLGDSEMPVIQRLIAGVDGVVLAGRPFGPFIALTSLCPFCSCHSVSGRFACVRGVVHQSAGFTHRGARPSLIIVSIHCWWAPPGGTCVKHDYFLTPEMFQSPAFSIPDALPIISYYSSPVCYWSVTWLALAQKEMYRSKF